VSLASHVNNSVPRILRVHLLGLRLVQRAFILLCFGHAGDVSGIIISPKSYLAINTCDCGTIAATLRRKEEEEGYRIHVCACVEEEEKEMEMEGGVKVRSVEGRGVHETKRAGRSPGTANTLQLLLLSQTPRNCYCCCGSVVVVVVCCSDSNWTMLFISIQYDRIM